jgi:hypothetical protein
VVVRDCALRGKRRSEKKVKRFSQQRLFSPRVGEAFLFSRNVVKTFRQTFKERR